MTSGTTAGKRKHIPVNSNVCAILRRRQPDCQEMSLPWCWIGAHVWLFAVELLYMNMTPA